MGSRRILGISPLIALQAPARITCAHAGTTFGSVAQLRSSGSLNEANCADRAGSERQGCKGASPA
jgi:hypothetical protein